MELLSFLFQARQKTAKAIGRMIPPGVLATVDRSKSSEGKA